MTKVLYLAQPLDHLGADLARDIADRVSHSAGVVGWLAYRPGGAWDNTALAEVGPEVELLNREALHLADAVIAVLPSGVKTVGVPREIEWAVQNNVPVLVVTDSKSWALADVATVNPGERPVREAVLSWLDGIEKAEPSQTVRFHVGEGGTLPQRHHAGDAGFDLYASETVEVKPGGFLDVPTAVHAALPEGVYARITGRSSTWRTKGLIVVEGIIDTGYRGPLFAGVWNARSEYPVVIEEGERVAQLVLHDNISALVGVNTIDRESFDRLPGDGRGAAGFGSTGK